MNENQTKSFFIQISCMHGKYLETLKKIITCKFAIGFDFDPSSVTAILKFWSVEVGRNRKKHDEAKKENEVNYL